MTAPHSMSVSLNDTFVHIHTGMHACTHTYTHTCTHADIHTHINTYKLREHVRSQMVVYVCISHVHLYMYLLSIYCINVSCTLCYLHTSYLYMYCTCSVCILYVYCDATYIGEVVDCNEGACIPDLDPANGLTAHCLCPRHTSGQFCEMCKCRRRASDVVFDTIFWNRNKCREDSVLNLMYFSFNIRSDESKVELCLDLTCTHSPC